MLEEGRGGFADPTKYREVMTGLFFRGEVPQPEPGETTESGERVATPPPRSAIEELRAMHEQIAARGKGGDVTSPASE